VIPSNTAKNSIPPLASIFLVILILYLSQRRFIQEITQKLPSNLGVPFINKKAPVRRLFALLFIESVFLEVIVR
jgi:hypothetical protein